MNCDMPTNYETWRRSNGYWIRHITGPETYTCWQSTGLKDKKAAETLARSQDLDLVYLEEGVDLIAQKQRRELVKVTFERPQSRPSRIPTVGEEESLLSEGSVDLVWNGDRIQYCINLLAALTGLSLGEIQALQYQHVHLGELPFVEVANRWTRNKGLEVPHGEPRRIAIPDFVASQLHWVMTNAKCRSPEALVFQGDSERRKRHGLAEKVGMFPISHTWIDRRLHIAFANIGVNSRARGIEFDSWRNFSHGRGLLHAALKKRLAA